MEKIPTAEEWLLNHKEMSKYDIEDYDEGGYLGVNEGALYKIMIEFAKLHVEACKKDIINNVETCIGGDGSPLVSIVSILNSYPLENIK
jgi:hypothetical protein